MIYFFPNSNKYRAFNIVELLVIYIVSLFTNTVYFFHMHFNLITVRFIRFPIRVTFEGVTLIRRMGLLECGLYFDVKVKRCGPYLTHKPY